MNDAAGLVGRTFGEFVVRELLSSGGFGLVFRAEQPLLAREAVIKVLHTRLRASEVFVQRFLREARLASRLDHPYAAHTYAFGAEPDGVLWIAMELVRGTPLDRLLEAQGPIPLERFVPLLDRICEVVHSAHEQGIVHRDLKPANVMVLSRAGRLLPKLLDFGIAKFAGAVPDATPVPIPLAETEPGSAPSENDGGRLTEGGATMGSPLYMAPEQWHDAASADARTDLYALGVLAYEALTGRAPFTGSSRMQVAMAHARLPPPPLGAGFPPALDAVLARALAKRPEDRHASVLEFAAAFRAASGVAAADLHLPRLEERLRASVLAGAPQPLALAVAALEAARNAHQARDAVWQVVRVAVRLLGATAMAAHAHVGNRARATDPGMADALRLLRRRSLSDEEWLGLARELCRPFSDLRDAHPVPELVDFLFGDGDEAVRELLVLREASERGASDEKVQELLGTALPLLSTLLERLSFFEGFSLVVPGESGDGELWMGARRGDRPRTVLRVSSPSRRLPAGRPALVDSGGVPVLALWPFVQALAPTPGAAECLFFFEGRGRRGARLCAYPEGFEREDDELWASFAGLLPESLPLDGGVSGEEKCPFPGLSSFTVEDAASFFGREREAEAFVNRLRLSPLLAVIGPSGAGKSSFVQAGVIPILPEGWQAVTVRPGPAPLHALATRLGALGIETGDVRAELDSHPGALGTLLRAHAASRGGTVVLVVDQLEELFTLCEDAAERGRYAEAVVRAARSADDPVRVIFTLRDDFLLQAEMMPALRTRLGQGLQLLTTPAEPDLRRILVEPLERLGYEFDDPRLPDEMVEAVAREPSALALLSFTASKLWELRDRRFRQLGRKAYASLGGVGGALAQHAEATLKAMAPEEQRLTREVFRHAVTAEGTRAVLSRAELEQVLGDDVHAGAVVQKLVAARLLVASDSEAGGERVEITHEALLSAWPRLVAWRREDGEGARLRDQLRAAARQWEERGRPSGLLWRGDALAEYRLWRARFPGALTAVEEAFAAASLAEDARGRRNRRAAVGGAFVALVGGIVALLFFNAQIAGQRERAEKNQRDALEAGRKAELAAVELRANLVAQFESQGRRLVVGGDPLRGMAYLARAGALGATGRAHGFAVAQALRAADGAVVEVRHESSLLRALFSPDGRRLLTCAYDKRARLWDAGTGALLHTFEHADAVGRIAFSPDGSRIATGSYDGTAGLWDAGSFQRLHTLGGHAGAVQGVLFTPDGKRLLTVDRSDGVRLWDVERGALVATLRPPGERVRGFMLGVPYALSADGARIAVGDDRGTVRIWDARTLSPLAVLAAHEGRVTAVGFAPGGGTLLTAGLDGTASLWNLATSRRRLSVRHREAVVSAVFSPDGRRFATGSHDRTGAVWDATTGEQLLTLAGHAAVVQQIRYLPSGEELVTVSSDATVRLWDARTGRTAALLLGHRSDVNSVDVDAAGKRLVTASNDLSAIVWSGERRERVTWLPGHRGVVKWASFSADGRRIATAGEDGAARLWERGGKELAVMTGHAGAINRAYFSPDGELLATGGDDGTVRIWDVPSGRASRVLEGHTQRVRDLAWDPVGARVVSVSEDGTARVWSLVNGKAVMKLAPHGGAGVLAVAWAPSGKAFVTAGDDNVVRMWDAADGRELARHEDPDTLWSLAWDPSGTRLVSVTAKQSAKLWRFDAPETFELVGHVAEVPWAAFSPDGELVVTASRDGTARVWDAASQEVLAVLEGDDVWSAAFSPDGDALLLASDHERAALHELPRLTGSPAELDRLVRCRIPFEVDEAGKIRHRLRDRSACTPDAR